MVERSSSASPSVSLASRFFALAACTEACFAALAPILALTFAAWRAFAAANNCTVASYLRKRFRAALQTSVG
eukprot:3976628-Pleurochrysis_carterae.AAC.4